MTDATPMPYSHHKVHTPCGGTAGSAKRITNGIEIVYYVRHESGHIKIGTTSHPLDRLTKYASPGVRGRDRVLAIEFGGRDLEAMRHEQFAATRIGKSEQFEETPELMAHIHSLREAYHIVA